MNTIDSGEGLSGIPEANTYMTYDKMGEVDSRVTVHNDYASDQQVEALPKNIFHILYWEVKTNVFM